MPKTKRSERQKPKNCCKKAAARGDKFCKQCGTTMAGSAKSKSTATPSQEAKETDSKKRSAPAKPCLPLVGPNKPKTARKCGCGSELNDETNFCPMCGTRIGEPKSSFRLIRLGGALLGIDLPETDFSIGKSPDCDLAIDDDEFLSRKHAQFTQSDGMLFVEDMNSSNGTFLRVRRPIVVEHGDEIVLGTTVFRVEQVEA
ncbi:MAG: FHA domain-containing protein [Planctomycetes bacterium]|nr:FHA domain-containing protein [Planctomycetota bacterium]